VKQDCRIDLNASDLIMALNLKESYPNLSVNYHIGSNFIQTLKWKKYCPNFLSYCAANINVLF
jgi:hypothetical protein